MRAIMLLIIMFKKEDAHRHGGREGSREATDEKTYCLNNISTLKIFCSNVCACEKTYCLNNIDFNFNFILCTTQ